MNTKDAIYLCFTFKVFLLRLVLGRQIHHLRTYLSRARTPPMVSRRTTRPRAAMAPLE